MTLAEIRQTLSGLNVYMDWVTVQDAKESGLIPEPWHQFFEDKCDCGSDNIISKNRTQYMCCDPNCKHKIGFTLSEMFSRFGVLGLGEKNCESLWNELLFNDQLRAEAGEEPLLLHNVHTDILGIAEEELPTQLVGSAIGQSLIFGLRKIRSGTYTFPELAGKIGIQGFNTGTDRLFGSVNSIEELTALIKRDGGVVKYCQIRGVSSPEVIFKFWTAFKPLAIANFNLRDCMRVKGNILCKVCMTGRASLHGSSLTKNAFVNRCTELCCVDGNQLLEIQNTSGPATADFVLYVSDYPSAKFSVGLKRGTEDGNFGIKKVLITCDQFYDWLQKGVEVWKQDGGDFVSILTELTI